VASALGYEGPVSIGGFAAAIALVVCAVLVTWLLARWLTGRFSR
jgi:hypothetical protein